MPDTQALPQDVMPHEPVRRLIDELEKLRDELRSVKRLVRHQYAPIPTSHKYAVTERTVECDAGTRTYCPVGVRLATGRRPADLEPAALYAAAASAPSRRTVGRLLSDRDGVLRRVKVGGTSYVTEQGVQHYEKALAEGWVDGYRVVDKKRARH